jgi:hypothetical protein
LFLVCFSRSKFKREGDGIGPELCDIVVRVFESFCVPIVWDKIVAEANRIPDLAKHSFNETRVCQPSMQLTRKVGLKGSFETPLGPNTLPSVNISLRKSLNTYANLVQCFSVPGLSRAPKPFDVLIIRETLVAPPAPTSHPLRRENTAASNTPSPPTLSSPFASSRWRPPSSSPTSPSAPPK